MKKIKEMALQLWNDESAQGATEYILLLVIVVALALVFKSKIMEIVSGKLDELSGAVGRVTAD
jgi:hypothetical protein